MDLGRRRHFSVPSRKVSVAEMGTDMGGAETRTLNDWPASRIISWKEWAVIPIAA